jgi:hypothetical protein
VLRLLGFLLGATIGLLLTRYNILDSAEIYATRFALDAIGVGAWAEAQKTFLGNSAAWKLAMGLAVGGALGATIQYFVERQIHTGKR